MSDESVPTEHTQWRIWRQLIIRSHLFELAGTVDAGAACPADGVRRIGEEGGHIGFKGRKFNAVFCFVEHIKKLRACGDLKYGLINLRCSVVTPRKPPTWGHLSQMRRMVDNTDFSWAFLEADHTAAYKNIAIRRNS